MAYATSSKEKPRELEGGGQGVYCCIPRCMSAAYDRLKQKSGIAIFSFPDEVKHPDERRAWMVQINKFRRKGDADSFTV